jgi:hypothetical protein
LVNSSIALQLESKVKVMKTKSRLFFILYF